MSPLDVTVFVAFLALLLYDGVRHARRRGSSVEYLLAGRRVRWWAVGLSILATQASAVTLVGTVGMGFESGTRFLQFYYAMPLALLLIAVYILPRYHRARVFTAYEWLGGRFDERTRTWTAMTFLALRALSLGAVIYAPSTMIEVLFGIPKVVGILGLGFIAILYTTMGGLGAVIATDVKQMAVMVIGLIVAFVVVIGRLPSGISLTEGLSVANATGRLEFVDLHFDPTDQYNIWSALLGGTFLFLAYFGTDQSQVQRYFAGRDLLEQRRALLFTALTKIPFQLAILLLGVLIFTDAFFSGGPLIHRPIPMTAEMEAISQREQERAETREAVAREFLSAKGATKAALARRMVQLEEERTEHRLQAFKGAGIPAADQRNEPNFVFPRFVRDHFPAGLIGLFLAAVLAAALSSVDSELNALATVFTLDIRRLDPHDEALAQRVVLTSRLATVGFGIAATAFALTLGKGGPIIETVNKIGSFFYGALFGIFALGWTTRVSGRAARAGLVAGIAAAVMIWWGEGPWLYMNTAGVIATVVVGLLVERGSGGSKELDAG